MNFRMPLLESIKRRSIELLCSRGVPVLEDLPSLEIPEDFQLRSIEEISDRAIAMCIIYARSQGMSRRDAIESFRICEVEHAITPQEHGFIDSERPKQSVNITYSWIVESYWTLLWVLRFIPTLSEPNQLCDVNLVESILRNLGASRFRRSADVRTYEEILEFADLYYRYHWAVIDSPAKVKTTGIIPGIVIERDRTFTWLLSGQSWEDIMLDT